MTNSPAASDSSHGSGDEQDDGNQASKSTSKDRECQYCHQKFTSSSLGRHLDQFLSKKKPDGIHNVDEIRRLRGGITRRTARNQQKKEHDGSQSTQHSPSPQYTLPSYSELLTKTTATKDDVRFNRPHWQASGVITDPTSLNTPTVNVASPAAASPSFNAAAGQKRSFSTYAADVTTGANSETLRALELSLREVLDAVRTATTKALPPSRPFEFDLVSQTFPFLCLALLPVPPTLFQSTPFATPNTVPLSSPGPEQYEALHKMITHKINEWRWQTVSYAQKSNPPGVSISDEVDNAAETAQIMLESSHSHLDAAFQNYMSYSVEARHKLWTIEMLRSLKVEQDKVKAAFSRMDRMTQEAQQLQQQLDHLSMCQWPREMALWPPDRPSFDPEIQEELRKMNILQTREDLPNASSEDQSKPSDKWDYDRIVSKWRQHVREDRARRTGVQPPLQVFQMGPAPPNTTAPARSDMNSPNSTTIPTPRIPSTLSKSATEPNISFATPSNPNPTSRPASALATSTTPNSDGHAQMNSHANANGNGNGNGEASPTISAMIANAHIRNTAANGTSNGHDPNRRRIGILSDVDEHYGPRLAGLRRDR